MSSSHAADYCASKHAMKAFAEALRMEVVDEGLDFKVTTVFPYTINTGMFEGFKPRLEYLLPALDQNHVTDRVYRAMMYREKDVPIYWFMGYLNIIVLMLPTELAMLFA